MARKFCSAIFAKLEIAPDNYINEEDPRRPAVSPYFNPSRLTSGSMTRYALSLWHIRGLPQSRVHCPATRISLICLENAEGRPEEALSASKRYSNKRKLLFAQHSHSCVEARMHRTCIESLARARGRERERERERSWPGESDIDDNLQSSHQRGFVESSICIINLKGIIRVCRI